MVCQLTHLPLGLPARVPLLGVVPLLDAHTQREPSYVGIADTVQASLVFLHQSLARFLLGHDRLSVGVKVWEPIALEFEQSHFLLVTQDFPPGG